MTKTDAVINLIDRAACTRGHRFIPADRVRPSFRLVPTPDGDWYDGVIHKHGRMKATGILCFDVWG